MSMFIVNKLHYVDSVCDSPNNLYLTDEFRSVGLEFDFLFPIKKINIFVAFK